MKLKCICLLIALFVFHLTASPNRYFCGKVIVSIETDDSELLPTHYFLNHI